MKKVFLSVAFLAFAGLASAKANSSITAESIVTIQDSTQRKPVKLEELPDAVKATLASDTYKDWAPQTATWVKVKDTEYFEIAVKKGEEAKTLKIDPAGKVIE